MSQELISSEIKEKILAIWDQYSKNIPKIFDTKGNDLGDIDSKRIPVIIIIKEIVNDFVEMNLTAGEFKTSVDSINKQNNLWGFTSVKGQMFFNLLLKTVESESHLKSLTAILRRTILAPSEITDGLHKIDSLEEYCKKQFIQAKDKRRAPNPNSVGYFLSYFWQVQDRDKWPVMYSSLLKSWEEIGLWEAQLNQSSTYHFFYMLNHEVKKLLSEQSKKQIGNWDVEHLFWDFKPITAYPKKDKTDILEKVVKLKEIGTVKESSKTERINKIESIVPDTVDSNTVIKASFDINEYLIPRVTKLIDLGNQTEKGSASKGFEFEKLVGEIFKQLDFEVETLGQGKGREPDLIIKFREEQTAFIVDAKAYSVAYSLGIADRAFKEYINRHCPRLQKEGFKKIGFIIVSNSFKTNFDDFISEVTWNTEIRRFVLMTSSALQHLLAFKTKDKLSLSYIIERIVSGGNLIRTEDVIEEFDDV